MNQGEKIEPPDHVDMSTQALILLLGQDHRVMMIPGQHPDGSPFCTQEQAVTMLAAVVDVMRARLDQRGDVSQTPADDEAAESSLTRAEDMDALMVAQAMEEIRATLTRASPDGDLSDVPASVWQIAEVGVQAGLTVAQRHMATAMGTDPDTGLPLSAEGA